MKRFSPEEVEIIKELLKQLGEKEFAKEAAARLNVTRREILRFYRRELVPIFDDTSWSLEENDLLKAKYQELGPQWTKISSFFQNRTPSRIKNHFYELLKDESSDREENVVESFIPFRVNSHESNISDANHENMSSSPVAGTEIHPSTPDSMSQVGQYHYNSTNYYLANYPESQPSIEMYEGKLLSGEKVVIPKTLNGYTFIREIGQGSFSSNALAQKIETSAYYNAKIIPTERLINTEYEFLGNQEIGFLRFLQNNHLTQCYRSFKTPDNKYLIIIMELYEKDLYNYILFEGPKSPEEKKKFAYQMALAVQYLHHNSIAHLDIKPENFLIKDGNIYLSDFGFAKFYKLSPFSVVKTVSDAFAAPEYFINNKVHVFKLDIYALGITFWLLATQDPSFYCVDGNKDFFRFRALYLEFPIDETDELQVLAQWCLKKNPDERPTIDQILNHNFFKGF